MTLFIESDFRPQSPVTLPDLIHRCQDLEIRAICTDNAALCPELVNTSDSLTIYRRAYLTEANKNQIKEQLAKNRFQNVIVSVYCQSVDFTKWCVLDNRVDIITVDVFHFGQLLDHKAANMLKNKCVEINLHSLIYSQNKVTILRNLQKGIHWLKKGYKSSIIFTAGANDLLELRSLRNLAAIGSLFGLSYQDSLAALSTNCELMIKQNLARITHGVTVGVWKTTDGESSSEHPPNQGNSFDSKTTGGDI